VKVIDNTDDTVTVVMETSEAVKLAGGEGVAGSLATQDRLREQLLISWFARGTTPETKS
jgi:hypothetical protein